MNEIKKITFSLNIPDGKTDEFVDNYEKMIENQRLERERQKRLQYYCSPSSGVPPLFYKESFDTYKVENEQDRLKLDLVKNFSKSLNTNKVLLLTGNVGNGKSHLGASIIREAGGLMVMAEDIVMEYLSSTNFNSKNTTDAVMNKYSMVAMLVIDEFGRGIKADKEAEIVGYILRKRYSNLLPTCIISNLSKEQIVKSLGSAVLDRLTQTCTAINFEKPSYRKYFIGENK